MTVIDKGNGIKVAMPKSTPDPNAVALDPQTAVIVNWQTAIHHELKSINSKLSFFVFLAIVAIIVSFLSPILR